MSKWGVFDTSKDVHVVPCADSGDMKPCHVLERQCWCDPIIEIKPGARPLIVHHEEN